MKNYEKAMELLKKGKAEKHRTFDDTGIIWIDLPGNLWAIAYPKEKDVEIVLGNVHENYGYISDDLKYIYYGIEKVEIV